MRRTRCADPHSVAATFQDIRMNDIVSQVRGNLLGLIERDELVLPILPEFVSLIHETAR